VLRIQDRTGHVENGGKGGKGNGKIACFLMVGGKKKKTIPHKPSGRDGKTRGEGGREAPFAHFKLSIKTTMQERDNSPSHQRLILGVIQR